MKIKFIQNIIDNIRGKNINWKNKNKYVDNIKRAYKNYYKTKLNLENPKTFTEKLMWLRVYDNTPLKTLCSDKYEVKKYIKEKIGEEYVIPLLGVYDNFDEIDFNALPDKFVLKCNHGSGYNIIIKDKTKFDKADAKIKINKWMKENYAYNYGEIQYSDIKRKIIAEEYIENTDGDIEDYKYFCFNGKPYYIQYIEDRVANTMKNSFFDLDWNNMNFYNLVHGGPISRQIEKPKNLEKMTELAYKLSEGFKMVRVDFYNINGRIFFGELTFTPMYGHFVFQPPEWNEKLGELLDLNNSENKYTNENSTLV